MDDMDVSYNPFSLERKKILITGASSGIGKVTAIECARLGAKLTITGRNKTRLSETLNCLIGNGHQMIIADLTNDEDIGRLVSNTDMVDGIVLCSGINNLFPLKMATRNKMLSVFDANYFAPVELSRQLLRNKKINPEASIVALASIQGITSWGKGNGAYCASKAALASWAHTLSVELSSTLKIRVNSICPGMTETPLIHSECITEEDLKKDAEKYLMHRYATPKEVAWAIIYFLSDASKWVTGTNFIIDGGFSIKL
jgi:2-deoxy-D-gluconate 3-dehydrogenase